MGQGEELFFKWSEQLSTQVEKFDKQHQMLIQSMNHFYTASQAQNWKQAGEHLKELSWKCQIHFNDEEAELKLRHYPELKKHKQAHERLLAQLSAYITEFQENRDPHSSAKICRFLKTWIAGHILGMDKAYSPFVSGNKN